jgi:hypothetical protein
MRRIEHLDDYNIGMGRHVCISYRDYRRLLAVARAAEGLKRAAGDSAFDSPSMWQAVRGVLTGFDRLNARPKERT